MPQIKELCRSKRTRQGDVDGEEAVGREVLDGVRDALLAQHARHVPVQRAHAHLPLTTRCAVRPATLKVALTQPASFPTLHANAQLARSCLPL